MRIKILIGTVVAGEPRAVGDIVECPDVDAKGLIATGQAMAAGDKAPKKEAPDK